MKLAVMTLDAGSAGDIELDDAVFGISEIRSDILQRMVRYQLSKRQSGTHATQSRSNVSRTTKKLYKQKGTGGARHGSRNAPIFVGGGTAHGPHPHSHAHDLTKKVRALALRHALSTKVKEQALIIIDKAELAAPKTKDLSSALKKLGVENALVIGGIELNENFARAAGNIPNVDVLPLAGLNVYDVLRRKTLVLTREAVDGVHRRFDAAYDEAAVAIKGGDADFIDDVILIDGVGDKSSKLLVAEGFATLTKLAALSDDEAAALFEKIGFADKAAREEWLLQARELVEGEAPRAKVDQRLLATMRSRLAKKG